MVMAALVLIILVPSAISAERIYLTEKTKSGKIIFFLDVENGKAIFVGTTKAQWWALYKASMWDTGKINNEIQFEVIVNTAMRHMLQFKTFEMCNNGVQQEIELKHSRNTKDFEGRMFSGQVKDVGKEMVLDLRDTIIKRSAADILAKDKTAIYSDQGIVYSVVYGNDGIAKFTTAKSQWIERYKKNNPGADALDIQTKWHKDALRGLTFKLYQLCTKETVPANDASYLKGRLTLGDPVETKEDTGFDLRTTYVSQVASDIISQSIAR